MAATCSTAAFQRCEQRPCPSRSAASSIICSRPAPQQRLAQRQRRQQCRHEAVRCQAAGGFSQPTGSDQAAPALPNSREECIAQAAAAVAAQVDAAGGKSKGFSAGGSGRKLSVDVPVLEAGPEALVKLAQELLAALPRPLAKQFTIVSCGEGAAPSGGGSGGAPVVGLQQCVREGRDLTGCVLIAGPSSAQLDAAMRLLAYWRGPAAVVLNAGWAAESAPVEQVAFIKSFEAVYCFLPLMVKVLFIGQDGAVFKNVTGGNPSSTPWRIFGKEGNKMVPLGRMQQRPSNADLEGVFYNAYAANNPLQKATKGAANFFRGLGGKGPQQ